MSRRSAFWAQEAWGSSNEAVSALWRSYPLSVSNVLMEDILCRATDGEEFDIQGDDGDKPYRTGGVHPLTQKLRLAPETKKSESLMSGVAAATRKGYARLWYERVRFCALRCMPPWLTTDVVAWEARLIDFPMWLKEMIRLGAATCARYVSAIRFSHIVSGYTDFTNVGQRYRIVLKYSRMNRPSEKKSPSSTDLLKYIHEAYVNIEGQRLAEL